MFRWSLIVVLLFVASAAFSAKRKRGAEELVPVMDGMFHAEQTIIRGDIEAFSTARVHHHHLKDSHWP